MFDALRKVILAINIKANRQTTLKNLRMLVLMAVRSKGRLLEHLEGIQKVADLHEREIASWVAPEAITAGLGGRFDACDLRHWIALATRAGVDFVPAREILTLSEDEMSRASGQIEIPPALRAKLARTVQKYLPAMDEHAEPPPETEIDPDALAEKLASALELGNVPEGWMVRHVRCGPSTLKALAGVGAAGPQAPEVRFGPELEIGPGWVRHGNRRSIHAADQRIVESYAQGPGGPSVFVARPWVAAARFTVAEDPHRHGTQFAGKGLWPAEWRAFIEGDEVTGVSYYYPWAGEVSAVNAGMALQVRDLARCLLAEAKSQNAIPAYPDLEMLRDSAHFSTMLTERFPRDKIACTIDFIETAEGLKLLEAGPAFSPVGGGHPCGFASRARPEGVAFRCIDDVLIADPRTWLPTRDPAGAILSWEEVEQLALQPDPEEPPAPPGP